MIKICKKCEKELDIDSFTIVDKSRGYRHNSCKVCRASDQRDWRRANPEKHKKYKKNYYLKTPLERVRNNYRRRLYKLLKQGKITKQNRIFEYLGCDISELKTHLEKTFTTGMSWQNYGKWHIDHIKPLSLGKNEEEIKNLSHYSNLQALWAKDNIKKSNRW